MFKKEEHRETLKCFGLIACLTEFFVAGEFSEKKRGVSERNPKKQKKRGCGEEVMAEGVHYIGTLIRVL